MSPQAHSVWPLRMWCSQGEALAVGGSDIDAWHLGEDLHNAAGTSALGDGAVQECVSMGILPVVGK